MNTVSATAQACSLWRASSQGFRGLSEIWLLLRIPQYRRREPARFRPSSDWRSCSLSPGLISSPRHRGEFVQQAKHTRGRVWEPEALHAAEGQSRWRHALIFASSLMIFPSLIMSQIRQRLDEQRYNFA